MVASDAKVLKAFHALYDDVIFKPLDGMGGASIFRARKGEPNLNVLVDANGSQVIENYQRYLPEINFGDKRILMINGYPVDHVLARIPSSGETRGNLAAGGSGVAQPLTDRDRWICEQIGPVLRAKEIHFAGLDVIGDSLTEINVTSPTCIREIDDQTGSNIAAVLMQHISQLLAARST